MAAVVHIMNYRQLIPGVCNFHSI